ncbi:F0F1 ATP synthase subunit epsilon [Hyphococcus sp.]|jgi:F-type H+-transporting ATPase subunit epsilon|uniref:F0F1 ATP synthase subunit epsilon n=1 Tax=Hyphococcus sp. TaxID=2038636 RepID=UPI003D119D7C
MADKLHFNLVSPERELMSADVDQVDIPGAEGLLGVLPKHSPVMTILAPGVVRVKDGSEETRIFVRGGFADISPAGLTVLAEEAVLVKDLNADDLARRIKNREEDLADMDTLPETRRQAEMELKQLKELQAAL